MNRMVGLMDRIATWAGVAAYMRGRARRQVTILMYHKVLPDALAGEYPLRNLVVSETVFRQQMQWLSRHSRTRTVAEAMGDDQPERTDMPVVCVTFDDGYLDNYAVAAPAMEEEGIRGTFFITTDLLNGRDLWFDQVQRYWSACGRDRIAAAIADIGPNVLPDEHETVDSYLGRLKRLDDGIRRIVVERMASVLGDPPPSKVFDGMSVEHVRELHQHGHEIASHSVSHPILTRLDDDRLEREVRESRQVLESCTGGRVAGFCYPNGDVDERVCRWVERGGYVYACTTQRGSNWLGRNNLLLLRRMVTEHNSTTIGKFEAVVFACEVWGVHDCLRRHRKQRGTPPRVATSCVA